MANRAPTLDPKVYCIRDLMREGSKALPPGYRDYYNGGAMDMITLRENEEAFNRYKIRPRVLRNVSQIDTSAEIFGYKTSFPCGFSPAAMHKLAHPEGELATSRAAATIRTAMALSSYATTSLEDVKAQGADNPYMIQMCIVKDRRITLQLLERAEKVGYKALFLSVDVPVLGRRLGEMQHTFSLPSNLEFPNITSSGRDEFSTGGGPTAFDDTVEWEEVLPWLRAHTKMEIWLKGITSPEDVEQAISSGVDGIIISNHGGRQLDGMPATLDALRQCAVIAQGRVRIAMDGGIRRGSDIFKALALGAEFCFVGRIPIWGLAYKGQAGVELGMNILQSEFQVTMALAGCRSVKEITRNHLSFLDGNGLLAKL
ncbi:MAG: hypothetical protein Q9203_006381 [Teloschistes exilis]